MTQFQFAIERPRKIRIQIQGYDPRARVAQQVRSVAQARLRQRRRQAVRAPSPSRAAVPVADIHPHAGRSACAVTVDAAQGFLILGC